MAPPTEGDMASTEEHQRQESRRSQVRVLVTYGAALFLFFGGALMIAVLLCMEDKDSAKDLFLAIMPVSAGILSYWFASRNPAPGRRNDQDPNTR